ncbi:flagellar basal-body MS-ring/collar protein FliF [Altererythrobacter sp. Z27]|uniref:flagellar basal-body MS-ring/collar protein FliF n=1 Tax=Altererythrobacter sp. Z27 TaxID=3461147 RepID=UPI004043A509
MSMRSPSTRLFIAILLAIICVLSILWFAFLRTSYATVYENIRETDASAIVAELDAVGIPYRLENEGHDILVPEDQIAQARVSVAGSNLAMGGTVGFELFNDSDMGLTEFAQKINFQRAMQGELARSIMMMDGIEFARVHLAIPERSIFRAGQESPTAAVSLETTVGKALTDKKIQGIQQLVASSVPGLTVADVAVLSSDGNLVSGITAMGDAGGLGAMSELAALESYFAAKGRTVIEQYLPKTSFDIEFALRPLALGGGGQASAKGATGPIVSRQPEVLRDGFAFRILVRTPIALDEEERTLIQNALADSLQIVESRGDVLIFSTGALSRSINANPGALPGATPVEQPSMAPKLGAATEWGDGAATLLWSKWLWIGLVLLALVGLAAWPRKRLNDEEIVRFADLLKDAAANGRSANRD